MWFLVLPHICRFDLSSDLGWIISVGRLADCQKFCSQREPDQVSLPTVSKYTIKYHWSKVWCVFLIFIFCSLYYEVLHRPYLWIIYQFKKVCYFSFCHLLFDSNLLFTLFCVCMSTGCVDHSAWARPPGWLQTWDITQWFHTWLVCVCPRPGWCSYSALCGKSCLSSAWDL